MCGVKVFYLQPSNEQVRIRFETKFSKVSVRELVDFYLIADKRMAWESSHAFSSVEEVKSYPLNTSLLYVKHQQRQWLQSQQDMLILTHGVELKGNRYYLSGTTVEHDEFPPSKSLTRIKVQVSSNYFEATTDGKGVKNTYVTTVAKEDGPFSG